MDGRSMTATELARTAGVTAATASRHLALLVEAELLQVTSVGRHRYHCIKSEQVATLVESLMQIAAANGPAARPVVTGPKDESLRKARTCYDHLAGRLGVAVARRLVEDRAVVLEADGGWVTDQVEASLQTIGIVLPDPADAEGESTRPLCRPCMDWSERRVHVAGRVGALICTHCLSRGWVIRKPNSRSLEIPPPGQAALRKWLGWELWRYVTG
jgi:hypothetical protein